MSIRSKRLFTTEFISLTVLNGKPQQVELPIFVHLKLGESLCHVIQIDYGPKLPIRHEPGKVFTEARKNVVTLPSAVTRRRISLAS